MVVFRLPSPLLLVTFYMSYHSSHKTISIKLFGETIVASKLYQIGLYHRASAWRFREKKQSLSRLKLFTREKKKKEIQVQGISTHRHQQLTVPRTSPKRQQPNALTDRIEPCRK